MAELILPCAELLELMKGARPLPEEVTALSCEGDSVLVSLWAAPLALEAHLRLRFESFAGGVVTFGLELGASARSEATLHLLRAVGVPEPGLFNLHVPRLGVDLNLLLRHVADGVMVTDFRLEDAALKVAVRLEDFRLLKGRPALGSGVGMARTEARR